MTGTFQYMGALKQIDVSGFNTANVTSMSAMFTGDTSLTSLDISNWDMTSLTSSFTFPPNLKHMILGEKFVELNTRFPKPPSDDDYVGSWIKCETGEMYTPNDYGYDTFPNNYGEYAGEYVWVKRPKLNFKDITIYKNDTTWTPKDNYVSGTDEMGEDLPFEKIEVVGNQLGNVNVSKPGNYVVEYRYYYGNTGYAVGKSTVTVKDIQTKVDVHDSELYVGTNWEAKDNFDSAIDKDGNPVEFKDVTVEGTVDTTKAGTYEVKYSYDGVTSVAKITVKAIQTAVNVHDSELYVGTNWEAKDNFDSAIDKDGNPVEFKDVTVEGTVDTTKAGTYEVKYSYDGVTSVATVTVKDIETTLVTGTWGTVPWMWDEETKTIELEAGNAGVVADAPWKTYTSVEQIIVKDNVVFPASSSSMFSGLSSLVRIENAGNFDMSKVTSMTSMFQNASSLTELDVSNWDVSNVIAMLGMFQNASSLTELDVSNWDVSNVIAMLGMFPTISQEKTNKN